MSAVCVIKSATPITIACLNSVNQIWNFTTSQWEAIPASGTPGTPHLKQLAAVTTGVGSLAQQLIGLIPDVAANTSGAYIVALACTSTGVITGTPGDLLDCIPMMTSPSIQVLIGGVGR
jgi:hypothetical protein